MASCIPLGVTGIDWLIDCIELCHRYKSPYIVTSLDSIDRGKIPVIGIMMEYKVHTKIIDSIYKIYNNDATRRVINEDIEELIKISSRIK